MGVNLIPSAPSAPMPAVRSYLRFHVVAWARSCLRSLLTMSSMAKNKDFTISGINRIRKAFTDARSLTVNGEHNRRGRERLSCVVATSLGKEAQTFSARSWNERVVVNGFARFAIVWERQLMLAIWRGSFIGWSDWICRAFITWSTVGKARALKALPAMS